MSDDLGRQRRYKDAAPYYSRYRPPYPPAMVSTLRDTFRLDGTGLLLDLGSGPGSVAIPLAHLFSQVIAIDPEPNMLEEGRAAARRVAVANVKWVCGSSEDLPLKPARLRMVTMGESFHLMDQARTLDALHDLIASGGGVAILGRGVPLPLPAMTPWRAAVCRVVRRYLGDIPLPWDHLPPPPDELHQAYLKRSRFEDAIEYQELFEMEWTVESIIGNLYSMSFCNRGLLGDRARPFEDDLRATLLGIEPSGVFRGEAQQFFALMAFKR
jgi:SAM-dependent methyltransferase